MDPNEREERVMDGLLVIAMNKHREICTIQSSGGIMLLKDQVSALDNVPLGTGLFFLEAFSYFFKIKFNKDILWSIPECVNICP